MVRRYDGDLKAQMLEDYAGPDADIESQAAFASVYAAEKALNIFSASVLFACFCQALAQSLSQSLGHSFARSDRRFPSLRRAVLLLLSAQRGLGFLTTCPSNLGTAFRWGLV